MKTTDTIKGNNELVAKSPAQWRDIPSLADVLVVDVETSGLDPSRHGVLEIGAVKPDGGFFRATCWLMEGEEWEAAALAVNGRFPGDIYSQSDGGKDARSAFKSFEDWLLIGMPHGRWRFCGQNVGKHDWWFLAKSRGWGVPASSGFALDLYANHRTLELGSLAQACELAGAFATPPRGWSADAIFEACGLGPEPKPHSALTGARMSAEALRKMTDILIGAGLNAKTQKEAMTP